MSRRIFDASVGLTLLTATACLPAVEGYAKRDKDMSVQNFVRTAASLPSLDRLHVEKLLRLPGRKLRETVYHDIYAFDVLQLEPTINASDIELRDARGQERASPNILTMKLHGRCVTLEEVRAWIGALEFIDAPRGISADERTVFEAKVGVAIVRFGFDQSERSCLADLAIETRG